MPQWFDNGTLAARLRIMLNAEMIIACPACTTRYVVPDSAIGVDGRTVRCAKCRHSWFQDGPLPELAAQTSAAPQTEAPPPSAPAQAAPPAAPVPIPASERTEPFAEPEAPPAPQVVPQPPPAPRPVYAEEPPAPPAYAEDQSWSDYRENQSSFAHEPPFRPRRNMLKIWTWAAAGFAVFALAATMTLAWNGLPDWMPIVRQTFAEAQPDLVLDFPPNRQERRTLPNGTEFFGASGTVTNVGTGRRDVPTILIVLRDARERIVYSWEVAPPKRELAPGESVTINEAVTDVPKSASIAEIGWKPA